MGDISKITDIELQKVVADLKFSSRKLFARVPADPGTVEDYLTGQEACLRAMRFMQNNKLIPFTDSNMRFIIIANWYNTKYGCTTGTAMSCEHLLRYLEAVISGSPPQYDSAV
jgi:hypothetical protein